MVWFRPKQAKLVGVDLQDKIYQLREAYMPMDLNSDYHENKLTAIKKLNFILSNTERKNLHDSDFEELLLCALTLVYYFGMQLKLNKVTSRYCHWGRKRCFNKTEAVFQKTMDQLHPERSSITIKITLKFFGDVGLWPFESFVEQILEVVLYFNRGRTTLFHIMLTDIHRVLFHDVKSARHRMRVLYDLLKSKNWVIDTTNLLPFVTRLLGFFAHSIAKNDNHNSSYGYLRKGFEVCLRRIFERAKNSDRYLIISTMLNWFSVSSNMTDDEILEFSALIDYVATLYKVESFSESFREGMFLHVLSNLVGSTRVLYSLLGCRLLRNFLDRQNNEPFLMVPSIYYEFSQVRLKVGSYDKGDKAFIRNYRESLHEYLMLAVKRHCSNMTNLRSIFTVICCLVLEVPCGFTAAAAACIAMSVQDYALNGDNLPAICRYWLHAIVISIMSLICWVHKTPVLYRYVNQIIARRAKEAPQLNPPLVLFYNIGRHHITWNKPTLFFEDWELRYGLWKHFQDPQAQTHLTTDVSRKKAPTLDLHN